MKTKKRMKRVLPLVLSLVLTGSMAVLPVSAQELEEGSTENTSSVPVEETAVEVTGIRETLDSGKVLNEMSWGFFSESGNSADWYGRMGLPDYAASLYYTLAEGSGSGGVLTNGSAFSEETTVTANYSDGSQDMFNGIEVLNISNVAKMTEEEWSEIQRNLSIAYAAFLMDYPGVFWLGSNPKVTCVETKETDSTGMEAYSYQVFFMLKNYGRDYDLRDGKYQSTEVISGMLAERDQSIQTVLAGVESGTGTAGIVTYFKENLGSAAASMGADNSSARALKLLCDYAGIPCVLAAGSGGHLESYVMIDGMWYASDEINAEQDSKEDTGETEDEKKDDDKADIKDKKEKKEDEKETKSSTETKSRKKVSTARAAFRTSPEDSVAAIAEGEVQDEIKVTFYDEDDNLLSETQLVNAIINKNDGKSSKMLFGGHVSDTVELKSNIALKVKVVINGNESSAEVNRDNFKIVDGVADGLGSRLYDVDCEARGIGLLRSVCRSSIEVYPRPLSVDTRGLSYSRVYKSQLPKDFTQVGNITVSGIQNIDGGRAVQVVAVPDVPGGINNAEQSVGVTLKLQGDGAGNDDSANYTLGNEYETRKSELPIGDFPFSNTPLTIYKTDNDIDVRIKDQPDEFYIYDGTRKMPEVSVKVQGETLTEEDRDYTVRYGENINVTEEAEVYVSIKGGTKYVMDDEIILTFPINRARKEFETIPLPTKYGNEKEYDLNTNNLILPGGKLGEVSVGGDDIFDGNIELEGTILSYKIKDDAELDSSAVISIPVTDLINYEDYSIVFNVTVADKDMRTGFLFEHDIRKMPVGGREAITVLEPVTDGTVTYSASGDGKVATVDNDGNVRALAAGEVTITAKVKETAEYKSAETSYKLIVLPKKNEVSFSEEFADSSSDQRYKLEIEKGISLVPDALVNRKELNTAEKIEARLKKELKERRSEIPDENVAIYDVTLMVKRTEYKDDGSERVWWETVTDENFLEVVGDSELPVMLPYPAGTEQYDFTVVHMFTTNANGKTPGECEYPGVTKRDVGLQFTVSGLSPIVVGWEEERVDDPDDPNKPDDPDDPNKPDDPDDPNKPDDPDDPNKPDDPDDNNNNNNNNPNDNNNNNNQNGNGTNGNGTNGNGTTGTNGTGTTGTGVTGTGTGTTGTGTTGTASSGLGSVLSGVATGDTNQILLYTVLLAGAAVLIGIVCAVRKRRK